MEAGAGAPQAKRSRKLGAPTIADVADRAGYSPSTVSRVINGLAHVHPKTLRAVRSAIADLNYSPNMAARSLAGVRQVRLGLLYLNTRWAFLSELLVDALRQARKNHAQLVVQRCDGESQAVAMVRAFSAADFGGVILTPPLSDSPQVRSALLEEAIPTVSLGSAVPQPGLMSVRIDDRLAAATMTRFILSLGHRRIGFLSEGAHLTASACRADGYRLALNEAGVTVDSALIQAGDSTYCSGLRAAAQLLNLVRPPTAIFAGNDEMAAAAVAVARRRGLQIPNQLTVCGFEDTYFSHSVWPELTTVRQPVGAMAALAIASLMKAAMAGREGSEATLDPSVLQFSLVRRGSHGPVHTS